MATTHLQTLDPTGADPTLHAAVPRPRRRSSGPQPSTSLAQGPSRILVSDRKSGVTRPAVHSPPLARGLSSKHSGFLVERMQVGTFQQQDIVNLSHLVVLQLKGVAKLEWRINGRSWTSLVHPGQISLVPAHLRHSVCSDCLGEYLAVSLEHGFLLSAAAETGGLDATDLPLLYGADDPLLRELVQSLDRELALPTSADFLYAESVAHLIATHLLHRYSKRRLPRSHNPRGLPRPQLRSVLDFIQANIPGDLSLGSLAGLAGLSPCHFARLFALSVGMPPHRYVTRCRVDLARTLLCQPFSSLADVAMRVGFCDQSHLSRHFTRHYGLTPGEFVRRLRPHKVVV
jgi:AraC family transcriptional regulator